MMIIASMSVVGTSDIIQSRGRWLFRVNGSEFPDIRRDDKQCQQPGSCQVGRNNT